VTSAVEQEEQQMTSAGEQELWTAPEYEEQVQPTPPPPPYMLHMPAVYTVPLLVVRGTDEFTSTPPPPRDCYVCHFSNFPL
jgi:hypothetical protein